MGAVKNLIERVAGEVGQEMIFEERPDGWECP